MTWYDIDETDETLQITVFQLIFDTSTFNFRMSFAACGARLGSSILLGRPKRCTSEGNLAVLAVSGASCLHFWKSGTKERSMKQRADPPSWKGLVDTICIHMRLSHRTTGNILTD